MSRSISWTLLSAPGANAAIGVLFLALSLATLTDLRRRRIPNLFTFPAAAAGLLLHGVTGGGWALGSAAVAFSVWFAAGLAVWSLSGGKGIGAGDVKMVSAAAALVGFWPTFWLYFASNLLQVCYLLLRWVVQGTIGENAARLRTWIVSIFAPGTSIIHFKPAGMEDRTPHAPFMLLGAAAMLLGNAYGVLPW